MQMPDRLRLIDKIEIGEQQIVERTVITNNEKENVYNGSLSAYDIYDGVWRSV